MMQNLETPQAARRILLRRVWVGRGKPVFRLRTLLGGLLFGAFGVICYRVALVAGRWSGSIKIVAILLLIVALICLWQCVIRLWRFVAHLGTRGLLLTIIIPLLGFYLLAGLSLGSGLGWRGWWSLAQILTQQAGDQLSNTARAASSIPDDLALAFFGHSLSGWREQPIASAPADLADIHTSVPTEQSTPSIANPTQSVVEAITIGMKVRVSTTDGSALRAHESPGTSAATTVRFPASAELTVVDGPVEKDGHRWWRVSDGASTGWCVAELLKVLS